MVVVDAGSLLWKASKVRDGELPERQLKARLIMDSYRLSGVDGLTPGPNDPALAINPRYGAALRLAEQIEDHLEHAA